MSDQEIMDRIDTEIEKTLKRIWHIGDSSDGSDIAAPMESGCNSYINGLRFARALIEKRTKGDRL
jgi:hypothetical protein